MTHKHKWYACYDWLGMQCPCGAKKWVIWKSFGYSATKVVEP